MVGLDLSCGSDGLTPFGVRALVTTLQEYAPFATGDTNEERTQQIIHAHKHADDDKDQTADVKAQLQAHAPFQAFLTIIEAISPDDHVALATAAMAADGAWGILFLNDKLKGDKMLKERSGAKTPAIISTIFNRALAVNAKGTACPEWGNVIPSDVAKKILAGNFATIHFWNTLKTVVEKREGKAAAERIDRRLVNASNAAVFADPEALRYLEAPMRTIMSLIGFTTTDAYSFAALWKSLIRIASSMFESQRALSVLAF